MPKMTGIHIVVGAGGQNELVARLQAGWQIRAGPLLKMHRAARLREAALVVTTEMSGLRSNEADQICPSSFNENRFGQKTELDPAFPLQVSG